MTTTPGDGAERGRRIGDSVGMIRGASTRGIKSWLQHPGDDVLTAQISVPDTFPRCTRGRAGLARRHPRNPSQVHVGSEWCAGPSIQGIGAILSRTGDPSADEPSQESKLAWLRNLGHVNSIVAWPLSHCAHAGPRLRVTLARLSLLRFSSWSASRRVARSFLCLTGGACRDRRLPGQLRSHHLDINGL